MQILITVSTTSPTQSKSMLFQLTWAFRLSIVRHPSSARRSSVRQHFQPSSPSKPMGLSKPNFIRSLSGMGERKFIHGAWVTWPRWPPSSPINGKHTLKKLLHRNRKTTGLVAWYEVSRTWSLQSFFFKRRLCIDIFLSWSTLIRLAFMRKCLNKRFLRKKSFKSQV